MLKRNRLFSLVFLGTAWSFVFAEEAKDSETVSFPSLEVIESVRRTSSESIARTRLLGAGSRGESRKQEAASYLQHGMHAPNAESWKLNCAWEAMSHAAGRLNELNETLPEARLSADTLNELFDSYGGSLCKKDCGANYDELTCNSTYEYRSVDGTCNNLKNTRWGSAPQPFERFLPSAYGDGIGSFRKSMNGKELPNPRRISRILSNSKQQQTPKFSLMVMQWGQFIDHDVTLTPEIELKVAESVNGSKAIECCDEGLYANSDYRHFGKACRPIDVENDAFFRQDNRECLRFIRSMPTTRGCSFTVREQINQNTAFVDGSMIYGSEKDVADFVRTHIRGELNVSRNLDGSAGTQNLPPRGGTNFSQPCPLADSMQQCFLAGDVRVDEVPPLTAMHTAFIRLHNIIADKLCDQNPKWDDEMLFQETRRIVSALIQQITYRDWLPKVISQKFMKELDLDTGEHGYKDTYYHNINPTLRNVFSTAAFRFGHSLVPDFIKVANKQDSLPLEGNFFNINVIQSNGSDTSDMLKGVAQCPSEAFDGVVANTLTDKLFAEVNSMGKFFGLDLVSLNIQRGRDHGIPSYREWRTFCGLKDIKNFEELEKAIEKDIAKEFSCVYSNIDDVDLFPACLAEPPIDGGLLGPTFSCILALQFSHIKHGDRFWYEREFQPKPFTPDQLSSIRSQGLASILCMVQETADFNFQPDPFLVQDYYINEARNCTSYNSINLLPWKQNKGPWKQN